MSKSESKSKVVVVGAAGIDTNVYLYGEDIDFSVEANFSQNLDYIGQAGGYSAQIFSALEYDTSFIGFVGDDMGGREIRRKFTEKSIDVSALGLDPQGTKRSVNFMYKDGRRKNFYDGRGSMETKIDVESYRHLFKEASIAHFSIVNWARYLLPIAREEGCVVSCDIQDIVDAEDEYRQDFIKGADILFFSSVNHENLSGLMKYFLSKGPKIVVSGRGEKGAAVATKGQLKTSPAIHEGPPVIDTNGAGDSLAVGFLVGHVIDGLPPDKAILYGHILARHCCTLRATTDNLLSREQLDQRLAKMTQGF